MDETYKMSYEYQPFNNNFTANGYTLIQGVRHKINSFDVYIAGTFSRDGKQFGALYTGPLSGNGDNGDWELFGYKDRDEVVHLDTSFYGPNNLGDGGVEVVGSYVKEGRTVGLLVSIVDGVKVWKTLDPTNGDAKRTFVHSIMGHLAVGNYDLGAHIYSFIYHKKTDEFIPFLVEGSSETTLYGIWCNSENRYTVCGGCIINKKVMGFVSDIDEVGDALDTVTIDDGCSHIQGITPNGLGGYYLAINEINGKCRIGNMNRGDNSYLRYGGSIELNSYPSPIASKMSANTIIGDSVLGIYEVNIGSRTVPISYLCGAL